MNENIGSIAPVAAEMIATWGAAIDYKRGAARAIAKIAAWEHRASGAVEGIRALIESEPNAIAASARRTGDLTIVDGEALARACARSAWLGNDESTQILALTADLVHAARASGEDTPAWATTVIEHLGMITGTQDSARACALAAIGHYDEAGVKLGDLVASAQPWYPNMSDRDEEACAPLLATAKALAKIACTLRPGEAAHARALNGPIETALHARSEGTAPHGQDQVQIAMVLASGCAGDAEGALETMCHIGGWGIRLALKAHALLPTGHSAAQAEATLACAYDTMKEVSLGEKQTRHLAEAEFALHGTISQALRTNAGGRLGALAAIARAAFGQWKRADGTRCDNGEVSFSELEAQERATGPEAEEAEKACAAVIARLTRDGGEERIVGTTAHAVKRLAEEALENALTRNDPNGPEGPLIDAIAKRGSRFEPRTRIAIRRVLAQYEDTMRGNIERARTLYSDGIGEYHGLDNCTFYGPGGWMPKSIKGRSVEVHAVIQAYVDYEGDIGYGERRTTVSHLCTLARANLPESEAIQAVVQIHTAHEASVQSIESLADELERCEKHEG